MTRSKIVADERRNPPPRQALLPKVRHLRQRRRIVAAGDPGARDGDGARGRTARRGLLTVGRDIDLDALPPAPPNVRVERWVPQGDVLAHAAAVVCHGGAGSTLGALAAGRPVVCVPLFADQP